MASKGQEIRSSALTLRIVELEPELLVMDAAYPDGAGMPPAHFHPSQTETFTIVEGRMRAIIDGTTARLNSQVPFRLTLMVRSHTSSTASVMFRRM